MQQPFNDCGAHVPPLDRQRRGELRFALTRPPHGKVGSPRVTGSTKASALPSDRLYRFDLGSTCAGQTQATCRCPALKIQKMRALSIGHQDEGITGGLEDRMRSRTAAIE